MLKLSKKKTSLQNTLIRLDKQSLLKNKLQLNSDGFKMQWHLKHYDDLGDLFDVVSANTRYTMNRNDLTDFSQINSNVFVHLIHEEPNNPDFRRNKRRNKCSA